MKKTFHKRKGTQLYFHSFRNDIFFSVSFFITFATAISKSSCVTWTLLSLKANIPASVHTACDNIFFYMDKNIKYFKRCSQIYCDSGKETLTVIDIFDISATKSSSRENLRVYPGTNLKFCTRSVIHLLRYLLQINPAH